MRAKSLLKYSMIFILLIAVAAIAIDAALATGLDDYYRIAVVQGIKYCNCDDGCFENQGCLTEGSGWILNLPGNHQQYLDEAKTNGYNGVCAQLYFQGYEIPYTMTRNCTAVPAIPETESLANETANAALPESNASESDLASLSSSIINATANQTADAKENASQQDIDVSTAAEQQPAEEEEPKEALKEENDIKEGQIQVESAQDQAQQTQEEGKMVSTVYIVAGTTIIMGFFVLIGWLAYLLYRK